MSSDQTQLVIAYFSTGDQADEAAKSLKSWDKANDDIKLGAIGILYQTDSGKIKTKKYGQHNTGSGAKIGLLLGVLAALLPAVTLIGGVVGGAVGGGLLGSFSRKGLGLTDEELAQIKGEVATGKAALAVLASPEEVDAVTAELAALGGTPYTHNAPTDEIEQVATDVNAAAPDEIVADTAPAAPAVVAAAAIASNGVDAEAAAPEEAAAPAVVAAAAAAPEEAEAESAAPAETEAETIIPRTVVITSVHYEGEEYVQLRNNSEETVDLGGWTLYDKMDERSRMVFPEGTELKALATLKVFTAPGHVLTFNSKHPIWNNRADAAGLLNPEGEEVASYSYGGN